MAVKKEEKIEKTETSSGKKSDDKKSSMSWVKIKPAELEKIVVGLAKEGYGLAQIGMILRDKHGIPKSKLLGKKVGQILKDGGAVVKSDKEIVEERIKTLKDHIAKNKHDYPAARSLTKELWELHWIDQKSQ